jgi:U2-associated protein SR140
MTDPSKIKEFPDISSKLSAPTKKSAFEKQKAEAEAKRIREEAENAAALKEFQASFEDEEDDDGSANPLNAGRPGNGGYGGAPSGMGGVGLGGGPKRHFTQSNRGNSGPGTLGPVPGSLARKRGNDGSFVPQQQRERGIFAYEDSSGGGSRRAFQQDSDDEDGRGPSRKEEEKTTPKPTVQLSSLPPGTTDATVKALFPPNIKVDRIQPLPPSGPGSVERKSMSAIVTLGKDIPSNEIDSAVSALSKKYLGKGYYLSISRHLSSAVVGSSIYNASTANTSLPFGAKTLATAPATSTLGRVPPPGFRPGIAPPASLTGGSDPSKSSTIASVSVSPPTDIRQLKLINKTIESILTHGEEFEAVLMSQQNVREDEKWAWLWDPRSVGGVYYRWRLWSIKSKAIEEEDLTNRVGEAPPEMLFEDETPWQEPSQRPRYEFTGFVDEFVSDPEYDASEEEASDDEAAAQKRNGGINIGLGEPTHAQYLNPLQKAKFTHLLARLPTSTARLRRGDVARVTNFAICHAGAGAEEVVHMLMQNIDQPYSLTDANLANRQSADYGYGPYHSDSGNGSHSESDYEPEVVVKSIEPSSTSMQPSSDSPREPADSAMKEKEDDTPARLIALYVVSDILSSCATAGVKNAWKYKPLIEAAMKEHKIFERLGRVEKDKGWGRIKAERWRNSVMHLLGIWEGWNVFSVGVPEKFEEAFKNPPLTPEEAKEAKEKEEREKKAERARKGKWKSMKSSGQKRSEEPEVDRSKPLGQEWTSVPKKTPKKESRSAILDEEMEEGEIDGGPMETDSDPVAVVTMTAKPTMSIFTPAKVEPAPTLASGIPGLGALTAVERSQNKEVDEQKTVGITIGQVQAQSQPQPTPKMLVSKGSNRPRAVDMFADSDEE